MVSGARVSQPVFAVVAAVLLRPSLWVTAVVEAKRFAPDHWYRRAPFLPLPDPRMLRFRVVTQYGDPEARVAAADVVAWLRWCKSENLRHRGD